jgi:hypothetical protein
MPVPVKPAPGAAPAPTPKAKAPRHSNARLIFPGPRQWETWALDEAGSRTLGAADTPEKCPQPGNNPTLAFPCLHVFCIPLWLATADKSLLKDMVALQLERRGFGPGGQNAVWDYEILQQKEGRTQVTVAVLPPTLPDELQWARARQFEVSPRCLSLPAAAVMIWEELGRLVLAVTQNGQIVYWQALGGKEWTDSLVSEIQLILLNLDLNGFAPATHLPLHVWATCESEALGRLKASHGAPVQTGQRPAPIAPRSTRELVPAHVQSARFLEKKSQIRQRFINIGLAVYAVGFLLWGGYVGNLLWQRSKLQKELETNADTVLQIQRTSQRWDALETSVTPESFAAEILLQCASALPPEGVRLTTFGVENNRVIIVGEAKNATAPYEYETAIKANKILTPFRWSSAPPRQLPSGSWQFTLEGSRSGNSPTSK